MTDTIYDRITATQIIAGFSYMTAPKAARIIADFSMDTGIPVSELKGDGKTRDLVYARQDLMLAIRRNTDLSLPQIGKIMNRHHTTVLHGVREAQAREAARGNVWGAL